MQEQYDRFLSLLKHNLLGSRVAFLRFPKIKPRISYIFITVSSDARSFDSNFTEAILWCSIVTSVV